MKAEIVANYLSSLKSKTGLTYEAIAEKSKRSESTVKNLCLGKAEDPRIDTVAPVVYALGGSMDEMLNPDKNKDEMKETSVIALKDSYEFQAALQKETSEIHINNIRAHYEQHREDFKENTERILASKDEIINSKDHIIKSKDDVIKTLKTLCIALGCILGFCLFILVGLLILEVMNPNLGWIQY